MGTPYTRAPHSEGPSKTRTSAPAPNAALLIDFDNVTMGMRSDLSKEMKSLLNSDIIKGKVAVQRAYADWRRYPQYIVPLSEASIDLIFAPAYGSNKKNATDIRMAIDALELIFIRPEIGTFILLTGDSDFSSLVLKLKEYGKYVIGVGIQESSSDILVQNCDEYYSYTNLAGLRKTTEADTDPVDPWLLVERAVERMVRRNDVMRSDRLKQVMLEIDGGFDESEYGFSKFSRFLTEASSRGLVTLRRLDNGQYEVQPSSGRGGPGAPASPSTGSRTDGGGKKTAPSRPSRPAATRRGSRRSDPKPPEPIGKTDGKDDEDPLREAYDLLKEALGSLARPGGDPVRDSDVKRKMLELDSSFDEGNLGFSKFTRFLRQADDHGIVRLRQRETGNYEVALPPSGGPSAPREEPEAEAVEKAETPKEPRPDSGPRKDPISETTEREEGPSRQPSSKGGLGPRKGDRTRQRGAPEGPPPLLEGQTLDSPVKEDEGKREDSTDGPAEATPAAAAPSHRFDPAALDLPTDRKAIIRYLTNSYQGVGEKTAETLTDQFGTDLFEILQRSPSRIREAIPTNRAELLLEAWEEDYRRRSTGSRDSSDPTEARKPGKVPEEQGASEPRSAPRPSGAPSAAGGKKEEEAKREGKDEEEEDPASSRPDPTRLGVRRGRRSRS